jgi:hypothetical protein
MARAVTMPAWHGIPCRGGVAGTEQRRQIKGSKHANMKELRFSLSDGEWRIAFAFDPRRQAILLVGGSKSGVSERQFYRDLIRVADARFDAHLKTLPKDGGGR